MTLPMTTIPLEKMSTLGATGNWIQTGEQTALQTSQQTLGEEPTMQPPPPQTAQQLEEQGARNLMVTTSQSQGGRY